MGTFVTGLLEEVRQFGVEITIVNGIVAVRPAENLPARLREQLRAHKPEILEALRSRPATYSLTWQPIPQAECPHCEGRGECDCPACTLRRTEKPVPCLMCHPQKRQTWLAATRPKECWDCEECRLHGQPGPCPACERTLVQ
jgi:hypothetical protein